MAEFEEIPEKSLEGVDPATEADVRACVAKDGQHPAGFSRSTDFSMKLGFITARVCEDRGLNIELGMRHEFGHLLSVDRYSPSNANPLM